LPAAALSRSPTYVVGIGDLHEVVRPQAWLALAIGARLRLHEHAGGIGGC